MKSIEEIKKQRFQFLHKVYDLSGGAEFKFLNMFEIGKELGFNRHLTEKVTQYLQRERLIKFANDQGTISILHAGIREVEEALSHPDTPTHYFPPVNIISIGHMERSQIQQGSPEATQVITFNEEKSEELREVINTLKESIDQLNLKMRQKSDLQAEIQTIEAQMSSSKPKTSIITECLGSIRRILEGAAGSAIASNLLGKILALLGVS